ncbi:MAG: hypothetical protein QM785_16670 [Pyrinomonadaceae bacterium]
MVDKLYDLTLEMRPGYVFGRVAAPTTTKEIVFGFLTEAVEFCETHNADRILFVREIPEMLPDAAVFFMAERFAKVLQNIKLAVVNPYPSLNDSLKFVETATANRGARARLFSDIVEAEEWLLS